MSKIGRPRRIKRVAPAPTPEPVRRESPQKPEREPARPAPRPREPARTR